jgi:hypothetical protein
MGSRARAVKQTADATTQRLWKVKAIGTMLAKGNTKDHQMAASSTTSLKLDAKTKARLKKLADTEIARK